MKFLVFFVLCFIALTSAAPQLTFPGVVATDGLGGTVVAGPSVVNGYTGYGYGRVLAPGFFGVL